MLEKLRRLLVGLSRPGKRALLIFFDILALFSIAWFSFVVRLGTGFVPDGNQVALMLAAPLVALPVFVRMGLYRAVVRYLPDRAVWTIAVATLVATLLWVAVIFFSRFAGGETVPRTIPAIYWTFSTLVIAGSRFAVKYLLYSSHAERRGLAKVAIFGAGPAGMQLAEALRASGSRELVGFIDDDPQLQGHDVAGKRVYSPDRLPGLVANVGVSEVILTLPTSDPRMRRDVVPRLAGMPVRVRVLPAIADLANGAHVMDHLREIDIDELLGRSSVPADPALLQSVVQGKTVLVTGAGGSIGSELVRLVSRWQPAAIVLIEANEHALYQIDREIRATGIAIDAALGSVHDDAFVRRVLARRPVDIIFHAAAHKHVPLIEHNVIEGVCNNVIGTQVVVEAARDAGVERFVLISTDKAVQPESVMGASKRWAERIVRHIGEGAAAGKPLRYCAVRFGNVLGSSGSVVPLFREQIARGGPLTLTDERMTRYFMSIHEAAELIVQAGALCEGGEIFVLDMGAPIRIRDLAEEMVALAGLTMRTPDRPDGDIAIEIIGRRPGEKLREELFYEAASVNVTRHPKILRGKRLSDAAADIPAAIDELRAALRSGDEAAVRAVLFSTIVN